MAFGENMIDFLYCQSMYSQQGSLTLPFPPYLAVQNSGTHLSVTVSL